MAFFTNWAHLALSQNFYALLWPCTPKWKVMYCIMVFNQIGTLFCREPGKRESVHLFCTSFISTCQKVSLMVMGCFTGDNGLSWECSAGAFRVVTYRTEPGPMMPATMFRASYEAVYASQLLYLVQRSPSCNAVPRFPTSFGTWYSRATLSVLWSYDVLNPLPNWKIEAS